MTTKLPLNLPAILQLTQNYPALLKRPQLYSNRIMTLGRLAAMCSRTEASPLLDNRTASAIRRQSHYIHAIQACGASLRKMRRKSTPNVRISIILKAHYKKHPHLQILRRCAFGLFFASPCRITHGPLPSQRTGLATVRVGMVYRLATHSPWPKVMKQVAPIASSAVGTNGANKDVRQGRYYPWFCQRRTHGQ